MRGGVRAECLPGRWTGREDEEHGGEQVAQRGQEAAGSFRDLAGQRNADKEGADSREDLKLLRYTGDKELESEYDQEEHLGVVGGDRAADAPAVAQREVENSAHGAERNQQSDRASGQAHPGHQRGEYRQVEGHGQILYDQDAEDDGGLAVAEASEVAEHLGDDAGGSR